MPWMDLDDLGQVTAQIQELFYPRSVAVVGPPRGMKMGKVFLMGLKEQGFSGLIYPVHPDAAEIDGIKAYPSLAAIPGPVDLVIVLVANELALPVVRECAAKKVKGVVLFTAGYRETGTEEGRRLEDELVRIARSGGMRLIGPNCMGLYCPESGLGFFPQMSTEPGRLGVISHSGSMTNILGRIAPQRGLRFSKVVSLGNECDLNSIDFLAYLGSDPKTEVIGAYLEGIKDGRRFVQVLSQASSRKPVILWKVGLTQEGSRAAASHTGAVANAREVWEAAVLQGGGVTAEGFEDWVDALVAFSFFSQGVGDRVAIISGPGGLAVAAAEACGKEGLRLADLSPQTREGLAEVVPRTGTSLRNPIDVGMSASINIDIYTRGVRIVAADPAVDAVVMIGAGFTPEANELYKEAIVQTRHDYEKPILMVNIAGFEQGLVRAYLDAGVPFFDSVERALKAYGKAWRYQSWRRRKSTPLRVSWGHPAEEAAGLCSPTQAPHIQAHSR